MTLPRAVRSSFRARLTRTLLALALVLLTLTGAAVYLGVRHALLTGLDDALLALARTEAGSVEDSPGEPVHVHEEPPLPLSATTGTGYEKFALIKDGSGRLRARTSNLSTEPAMRTRPELEARALAGTISYADTSFGDLPLRAIYYPLSDAGREPMMMVVAVPLEPVTRSLETLLAVLGATMLLGGGAAAWAARRVARHLTAPLERLAAEARGIGEERLQMGIPEVAVDAELHAVEAALNQMLGRLERAFEAQRQLVEAQRQLVEAQRRFIADASHELRSPLTNLRGTLEVALRRERSLEEYQEVLSTSLAETERLSRLVSELLTLTRADSGRLDLRLEPCDLRVLAERSVRAHTARAEEAGVRVSLEAPAAVEVTCDETRLREVIDNLIDNALRYAPRGSTVAVVLSSGDGQVRLSVRDSGPGLTLEEQAHVFDRFYRADASRARHSGGLGLGLSIAKAIMDAHGGSLTVESRPGEGANFTLGLPGGGALLAERER